MRPTKTISNYYKNVHSHVNLQTQSDTIDLIFNSGQGHSLKMAKHHTHATQRELVTNSLLHGYSLSLSNLPSQVLSYWRRWRRSV